VPQQKGASRSYQSQHCQSTQPRESWSHPTAINHQNPSEFPIHGENMGEMTRGLRSPTTSRTLTVVGSRLAYPAAEPRTCDLNGLKVSIYLNI
jgi:hypothetical protein